MSDVKVAGNGSSSGNSNNGEDPNFGWVGIGKDRVNGKDKGPASLA